MPTTTRTTRSRRVSADEAEADTPPFDTDEETAKPTRLRRSTKAEIEVEEDDEEEAPATKPAARSRRKPVEEEVEEEAPKTTRLKRPIRDEDEDVEDSGEESAIPFTKGKAAIQAARQASSGGVNFVWLKDGEEQLVKFLDEEPWSYQQHWITRSGKQSFPCLGAKCPLCAIGSKVSQHVVFSIVNLSLPGGPGSQALDLTISRADDLFALDEDKKIGPLPKLWYALSRTELSKPKGFEKYRYSFLPLKDRDLEEDYGVNLDDAEDAVADAEVHSTEAVLGKVTRRTLQDIADEAMAE